MYFTTYEQLKVFLAKKTSNPESKMTYISFISGGLGRTFAACLVSPLELIRTKMQSQKMNFGQVRQSVKYTIKSEGLLGLWKGLSATLLRDVPFSAVYWPCYEYLRPTEFSFVDTAIAGAVAGSTASTLTLPMDVIKTRLQLELGESGVKLKNRHVVKEIIDSYGWKGLFRGLVPRLLKVTPACAIMISSYEYCKRYFRKYNQLL